MEEPEATPMSRIGSQKDEEDPYSRSQEHFSDAQAELSGSSHSVRVEDDGAVDEDPGEELEPGIEFEKKEDYGLIAAEEPTTALGRVLRHLAILSLLMFASIWGTLTREGLVALNTYSGMSIKPVIWAQAFGCLVMGWTVANRAPLEIWYPPIYIAIGTGYCGSVTTFSTWVLEVFQAFGNQQHFNRHGLHNVMDALTQTGATLGMSLISLSAGMALAELLPVKRLLHIPNRYALKKWRTVSGKKHPSGDDKAHYTKFPDLFCIALGIVFWAAAAILCGTYPPFRHVTYALVLSPPGAIIRWYLSRLNSSARSKRRPYWPLGTLTANLSATVVIAASFVGQRVGRAPGTGPIYSIDSCHAMYGIQEGFCGCLSTISTFAVELRNLKPTRRAVGYAVGSWVCGIIICVLIIGSPWWSIGMDGSCVGVTL